MGSTAAGGVPLSIRRRAASRRVACLALFALAHSAPVPAAPSWFNGTGLSQPAIDLLAAMNRAQEWGLEPGDYHAANILAQARTADTPERRAQAEAALSASALRFISHLHYGRVDPKKVGFDMPERTSAFDAGALLEKLATTRDTRGLLASAEPAFQHYLLLKAQLARYRELAMQRGLAELPKPGGRSIAAGEDYAGAPALRTLLVELGDLSRAQRAPDSDLSLDPQLIEALRRFQFRHGLQQDGVLGPQSYQALTTPMATRVRQIELTLERWRWLPARKAPTIIVNIPQFRLFAFPSESDREAQMLAMDVIVGQTYPGARTPVFAEDMKFVVFHPYWDVPRSIMSREMLPRIRSSPGYLATRDLEIVEPGGAITQHPTEEQIQALASGKSRLRQRPGPGNALGLVKFMLPNRYNVYLHSTPANELFKASRRAFSHGCIRVSDPVALAEYVLRQAPGDWSREKIEAAMHGGKTLQVNLRQPVQVLILYGTAVANEAGQVYFFEDIYGNDARLAKVLGIQ